MGSLKGAIARFTLTVSGRLQCHLCQLLFRSAGRGASQGSFLSQRSRKMNFPQSIMGEISPRGSYIFARCEELPSWLFQLLVGENKRSTCQRLDPSVVPVASSRMSWYQVVVLRSSALRCRVVQQVVLTQRRWTSICGG